MQSLFIQINSVSLGGFTAAFHFILNFESHLHPSGAVVLFESRPCHLRCFNQCIVVLILSMVVSGTASAINTLSKLRWPLAASAKLVQKPQITQIQFVSHRKFLIAVALLKSANLLSAHANMVNLHCVGEWKHPVPCRGLL